MPRRACRHTNKGKQPMNTTVTSIEIGTTKTGTKTHLLYSNRPWCAVDGANIHATHRNNITASMTVEISEIETTIENMDMCKKCMAGINSVITHHA
jgi:hypothetical protein